MLYTTHPDFADHSPRWRSLAGQLEDEIITPGNLNPMLLAEQLAMLDLVEQLELLELLEDLEFPPALVREWHRNWRQQSVEQLSYPWLHRVGMTRRRFLSFVEQIRQSSFFIKRQLAKTRCWRQLENDEFWGFDVYEYLHSLLVQVRQYACESILTALTPTSHFPFRVAWWEGDYHVLVRVRTSWEAPTLEETYRRRTFTSYSILTRRNHSRFNDGVVYGYRPGLHPEMIAHIYPLDALTFTEARHPYQLTNRLSRWLDIDDLDQATLLQKSYNQISIRTRQLTGDLLRPDFIVCCDFLDEDSRCEAERLQLPLVVVRSEPGTLGNIGDIYGDWW